MGEKLLTLISEKVERYKVLILLIGLGLGFISTVFTVNNCKINTNTEDMLSDELDWRVDYAEFKSAFPELTDTFLIVIESAIPELAQEVAEVLKLEMTANSKHFSFVSYPQSSEFFQKNALLYLDLEELEDLVDQISRSQALLGLLAENPNLTTILDTVHKLIVKKNNSQSIDSFTSAINESLEAHFAGRSKPISWQRLVSGKQVEETRIFLLVKPDLNFREVLPAKEPLEFLERRINALGYSTNEHVKISLTGSAALNHDELLSVTRGAQTTGIVALLCVTFILYIGLRSSSLIMASLISLFIGLACTAGFATLAIGTLNMISIAFAVLYVGLAIDFAIHICLRYQEYCGNFCKNQAIKATILELGRSISLCAFTTSIGFLAFVPTDYRGVAELGMISGVGMILSLIISLTVLPALLSLLPKPNSFPQKKNAVSRSLDEGQHDKKIFFISAILGLLGIILIQQIEFDNNPINLNDQNAPSVTTLKRLSLLEGSLTSSLSVLERDRESVERLTDALKGNPIVKEVSSVFDTIPEDQNEKLELIEELNFIMGGPLKAGKTITPSNDLILDKIDLIVSAGKMGGSTITKSDQVEKLLGNLLQLKEMILSGDDQESKRHILKIEEDILLHFPRLIRLLSKSLEGEIFELSTVPDEIKNLWYNSEGTYRIEVQPAIDPYDDLEMRKFVELVRSVADNKVTGVPVINLEAGNSVLNAFTQAFLSALALIFLVVWVVLRKLTAVLLIMAPIALACFLTGGLTAYFDVPFNFANIIALPLLMGIGIDSSIHIFHRYSISSSEFLFLQSSTSRAVIFSSLTTAASFGSLAASPHSGTASLGLLLAMSLACIIVSSLGLLPALIRKTMRQRSVP